MTNDTKNNGWRDKLTTILLGFIPSFIFSAITLFVAVQLHDYRIGQLEKQDEANKKEVVKYIDREIKHQAELRAAEYKTIETITKQILEELKELKGFGSRSIYRSSFTDEYSDYYVFSTPKITYVFSDFYDIVDTVFNSRSSDVVCYSEYVVCMPKDSEMFYRLVADERYSNIVYNLGMINRDLYCIFGNI